MEIHEDSGVARELDTGERPAWCRDLAKVTEKRLSLGINVSILLVLLIFGVLLSLPLRLLFDTNYCSRSQCDGGGGGGGGRGDDAADPRRERQPAMDHRKLRRCPNLQYENRLTSVYLNDYDGNCTYARNEAKNRSGSAEGPGGSRGNKGSCEYKGGVRREIEKENAEEILKARQMKSITVAGHILVAMLLVSVIAALVEVLRIRFAREKV